MKKGIGRNRLIIATLALLIAIAGYISVDKSEKGFGQFSKQANAEASTQEEWDEMVWGTEEQQEEKINPGETVLTGTVINIADYAASVKLNREHVRAENKATLLEIVNNDKLSEKEKEGAIAKMVNMTDIAEKEANAEMLLEAKGFSNVVVSISEDNCDVVLDMGEITDAKRAQVEDVVKRKTGIEAQKIVITAIHAGKNK